MFVISVITRSVMNDFFSSVVVLSFLILMRKKVWRTKSIPHKKVEVTVFSGAFQHLIITLLQ